MERTTAHPTPGQAIRRYLDEEGPSQVKLSRKIGIPNYELSRRLLGYRYYPLKVELVRKIARALNVSRDLEDEWLSLFEPEESAA